MPAPPDGLHGQWDALLRAHVRDGRVDYPAMMHARTELDAYISKLSALAYDDFASWPSADRMAVWINAYNAATVALILDHYPIDGIWSITPLWKRAFGGPFAIELIPLGHLAPWVGDEELSLNDVENKILRERFDEPRIHVAIVCASKGCPALQSEAYRAGELGDQLDRAFAAFMTDEDKNRYDSDAGILHVSRIFKWFAKDFRAGGGPAGYMARYGDPATRRELAGASSEPHIEYTAYDWSLNE